MPGSIPASATVEELAPAAERPSGWLRLVLDFARQRPLGAIGALIILFMVVLAAGAGWLAPYDPLETDYGAMLAAPSAGHWLGTDAYGRAEFQFPDGTVVRLDARSKLDYSGHEEDGEERIVLRLWSGSLMVRLRTRDAARFEIETPAGTVQALDQAMVRLDVDGGETRVSVYRGQAELDDGRGRIHLSEGERTYSRWGGEAEEATSFDIREEDAFSQWDLERESQDRADDLRVLAWQRAARVRQSVALVYL